MSRKTTRVLFVAAVLGAFTLTACSANTAATTTATPAKGGEITVGLDRELPTLDVTNGLLSQAPILMLSDALYEPLMIPGPGGTFVPGMAKSLTPNADATQWTLTIPAKVTFSDGSPLTAADIQAHIKRLADPTSGSSVAGQLKQITGMEIKDDTTIVFSLAKPNADFAGLLSRAPGMVTSTKTKDAAGFPLGAGPYVVKSFVAGDSVVVVRNPKFWGKAPTADTITFKMMPDADSRFQSLQSGDIDLMVSETASQFKQAKADDKLAVHAAPISVSSLVLNLTNAKFQDPKVREALAQAIDRNAINAVVNLGAGKPIDGPYGLLGKLAPEVDYPAYDEKAAQAVLKGKGLSFTLTVSSIPSALQRATVLKDMLGKVGVTVTINPVDAASYANVLGTKNFEAADFVTSIFGDPSGATLAFATGSPYNITGYTSPTVDKALAASSGQTDGKKRVEQFATVSDQLAKDLPSLWLTASNFGYISSSKLAGIADVSTMTLPVVDPSTIGWTGK